MIYLISISFHVSQLPFQGHGSLFGPSTIRYMTRVPGEAYLGK